MYSEDKGGGFDKGGACDKGGGCGGGGFMVVEEAWH